MEHFAKKSSRLKADVGQGFEKVMMIYKRTSLLVSTQGFVVLFFTKIVPFLMVLKREVSVHLAVHVSLCIARKTYLESSQTPAMERLQRDSNFNQLG